MKKETTKNFKALQFSTDENKIFVDYQNDNDKFTSTYIINTDDADELKDIHQLLSITTPDYIWGVISKLKKVWLIVDRKELEARLWISQD